MYSLLYSLSLSPHLLVAQCVLHPHLEAKELHNHKGVF